MSFITRHFGLNQNPKPFHLPIYSACIMTMLGITSQALSDSHKWRNGVVVETQAVNLYQQCDDGDWACQLGEAHKQKGKKK